MVSGGVLTEQGEKRLEQQKRLYNCARCNKYSKKGLTRSEVFESKRSYEGCAMKGFDLLCKKCKETEEKEIGTFKN